MVNVALRQKLFNKVTSCLIKQGCPAVSGMADTCMYLDPNGNKCAIGHLLTGKFAEFAADYKGGLNSLLDYSENNNIKIPSFLIQEKTFLNKLQACHDSFRYMGNDDWLKSWKTEMIKIAKRHKLEVPKTLLK